MNSGADFGGIRLTDNSHSFAIRNAANKFFIYDVTNTTQRVTLDDSGNFGIGTSTPGAPLDVGGGGSGAVARFKGGNNNQVNIALSLIHI